MELMDASSGQQHHQEMTTHSLESMLGCSSKSSQQENNRKPRPQPEQALKCPRCDSTNTKFCYYNNYSLSQPRYFCKSCRRYWTKGGTLRNVPVGGGCRKNKRSSSKRSSSQDDIHHLPNSSNPLSNFPHLSTTYDSNDLTLAFARLQKQTGQLGFDHHQHHHEHDFSILGNPINNTTTTTILGNPNTNSSTLFDALRSGFLDTTQNNFHLSSLYYGYDTNGNSVQEVENATGGGVSAGSEMLLQPYGGGSGGGEEVTSNSNSTSNNATTNAVTTMKQEFCSNDREITTHDQNKVLWGFPWQLNGDNYNNMIGSTGGGAGDNIQLNGFTQSWHGLINSPLM